MTMNQQRKALLSDRNYLFFWLSTFMTMAAGAMCYIILTWHVMSYASNKVMSSLMISIFFWLPSLLIGPFTGIVIDRFPRLKVLMVINSLRVIGFVLFALCLSVADHLWVCCLLNALNGFVYSTLGPVSMALIPELVGEGHYLAANSTTDIGIELGNVIGMAIAAALMSWLSIAHAFCMIAILMGVGVSLLFFIVLDKNQLGHENTGRHWYDDLCDGLCYLKSNRALLLIYSIGAILCAQFMLSPILLAPYIKEVLGGTGFEFGLTEVVLCTGVIVGSFLIPYLCQRIGRVTCLFACIVWLTAVFFCISQAESVTVVITLYGLLGLGLPLWSVITSYSQEMTKKSMQGRVQSVANSMSACLLMLVYLLLGYLSHYFSIAHAYWFCSVMGLLALVLLFEYKKVVNQRLGVH